MPRIRKEVSLWKCLRCLHVWLARKRTKPKWCPGCHSPYWDTPRLRPAAADYRPKKYREGG